MSSLAFLVTELQSLASETRRKHPDVREAAEKSLAILRSSPEQATATLAADGPQSEDLLRPVFMGCETKNAKVVAISLGSLQRLIALKAVPQSAVPVIVNTMTDCMNQGVDIQLRILQTLLSLITNFPAVHGDLLGDALLLCFKLQESRIAVVSSTAAATLRQLVMFVVDKVVDEDRRDDVQESELTVVALPNGTGKELGPAAQDAFSVFEDLCLLANSEKPHFLKLEFLRKTFALELIESVLTNYHDLFRKHPELLLLLQHHLCPLVLKALSDRPSFPLTLRSTRVVFLLLKQFSQELRTEAEVFLMLLIKIVSIDTEGLTPSQSTESFHLTHGARPQWMRVLAMEIMRGLCSDAELMRNVWLRYDSEESGSKVFISLVTALKRLVTEKPTLLGVSTQMMGVGIHSHSLGESPSGYGFDVGGVAGMVANAANATVSSVAGMIASEAGLSVQNSAMKLQCIDQLDKADSPPIPEPYIYLLGVQCLVSLCDGFASFVGPLYNQIMVQRPRAAGEPVVRAPPAMDISSLPAEAPTAHLGAVRSMIENGWPALLAALSFIISTNLSDELFVDVLSSYQAMTNVSGMLGLTTPRDAFFTSLAKLAIPARVVSSLDTHAEPPTPRTPGGMITENLGLTAPPQPPGLSERNMACLKAYIASVLFLAGSLGESWFDVLETLQNADYVLTSKGQKAQAPNKRGSVGPGMPIARSVSSPPRSTATPPPGGSSMQSSSRHPLLVDLDADSVLNLMQRLFDVSKNMDDGAFHDFVAALCKLSAAMVNMQTEESEIHVVSEDLLSPTSGLETPGRRRVSGIHLPRTLRSGDFGISKLGGVAKLNIHRLIYREPEVAWDIITLHLLAVVKNIGAPSTIRTQAAKILDDILIVVPRNLSTTGDLQPKVQRRVLDVLSQQVIPEGGAMAGSTTVEVMRMGLETLHQILQASGHTLVVGWETIFGMLSSVCKPASAPVTPSTESTGPRRPPPLGNLNEKSYSSLVKIAFQSLTLVCDSLSALSPEHLRLCISTLGQFGRQADTNIALTAAESLLWGVSDSIQAKRKDEETEPEYSALWMFLLLELLGLCTDGRPEVRVGAIQTLFRTLQLYGATLSLGTWDECIWKVTFPLLDSITHFVRQNASAQDTSDAHWDESKILALQSIGSIFHDFLISKIIHLESFGRAWEVFVGHVEESWRLDSRSISAPALRCLDKAVRALSAAEDAPKDRATESLEVVWAACDRMGEEVLQQKSGRFTADGAVSVKPFTQESLVAFVDVIRSTRSASKKFEGHEWSLDRLARLMAVLKGVLTYSSSPDYRPDVDSLSLVQSVVMEAIDDIDLTTSGAPSLVLRDLSEFVTLPFMAAFDVPDASTTSGPSSRSKSISQKRVTYIALCKKVMPLVVTLFLQFKESVEVYNDGTVEAILGSYSIPIKLKYECPAPFKYGKEDQPLWKTATTNLLRVVKECGSQVQAFGDDIQTDRVEGVWRQVVEAFRGGILADCSPADSLPLDVQASEESFDLALVASLEIDVVPHLGDARVPDYVVTSLAKVLQLGSRITLRDEDDIGGYRPLSPESPPATPARAKAKRTSTDSDIDSGLGSTDPGRFVPRERFSYWCFDLLFLVCSDAAKDRLPARKRVAALALPSLLERCRSTLVSFIADESLRGNLPFPRPREEELLYVLRGLLQLRLWPGSFWAATSDEPTKWCTEQPQPVFDESSPATLLADLTKRSTRAHLFQLYDLLCEIVALPRKTPSTWVLDGSTSSVSSGDPGLRLTGRHSWTSITSGDVEGEKGRAVELDARALARRCLVVLGEEMRGGSSR